MTDNRSYGIGAHPLMRNKITVDDIRNQIDMGVVDYDKMQVVLQLAILDKLTEIDETLHKMWEEK